MNIHFYTAHYELSVYHILILKSVLLYKTSHDEHMYGAFSPFFGPQ